MEANIQLDDPEDRRMAARVAYPPLTGDLQLRDKFFMQRRKRPMVPAPSNTPMPGKEKTDEGKARLYSLYLRPWALDRSMCTEEVMHVTDLDLRAPIRQLIHSRSQPFN